MSWLDQLATGVSVYGLVSLLFKATVVLMLASYLIQQFVMSAAAIRHRLWVAVLLIVAVLPIWSWFIPVFYVPLLDSTGWMLNSGEQWLISLLLFVYVMVALSRGAALVFNVFRIGWITLRAQPAPAEWQVLASQLSPRKHLVVRMTAATESPLTWGYLRPVLLIPERGIYSENERLMVFLHELRHIQRGDWLAQLLGQWVVILFWPVPGIRRAMEQLSLESEQACDDYVLEHTNNPADYAALLLHQARLHQLPATVALGRPSELAQRIRNLCTGTIDHSVSLPGSSWLYPLCIVLALPFAAVRIVERTPENGSTISVSEFRLDRWGASDPVAENVLPISRPTRPGAVNEEPDPVSLPISASAVLAMEYLVTTDPLNPDMRNWSEAVPAQPPVTVELVSGQSRAPLPRPP